MKFKAEFRFTLTKKLNAWFWSTMTKGNPSTKSPFPIILPLRRRKKEVLPDKRDSTTQDATILDEMNSKPTALSFTPSSDLGQTAAAVPGRGSFAFRLSLLQRLRHSLPLGGAVSDPTLSHRRSDPVGSRRGAGGAFSGPGIGAHGRGADSSPLGREGLARHSILPIIGRMAAVVTFLKSGLI